MGKKNTILKILYIASTLKAQKWKKNGFNPIPTSQGRNQPLYERHLTKSCRNRVKNSAGLDV